MAQCCGEYTGTTYCQHCGAKALDAGEQLLAFCSTHEQVAAVALSNSESRLKRATAPRGDVPALSTMEEIERDRVIARAQRSVKNKKRTHGKWMAWTVFVRAAQRMMWRLRYYTEPERWRDTECGYCTSCGAHPETCDCGEYVAGGAADE